MTSGSALLLYTLYLHIGGEGEHTATGKKKKNPMVAVGLYFVSSRNHSLPYVFLFCPPVDSLLPRSRKFVLDGWTVRETDTVVITYKSK